VGVEEKLRALELESIQDYIAESDNLVDLHQQVIIVGRGALCTASQRRDGVAASRSGTFLLAPESKLGAARSWCIVKTVMAFHTAQ